MLKVECDNKAVDLNGKYDEEKRQILVEKMIWRAGMKDSNSKDSAWNNIISTNHMVEWHSKYISNQKNCCNPLNHERHGSVKKVFFLFLLEYVNIHTYKYIYIFTKFQKHLPKSMQNKCFEYFIEILERYYEEVHFLMNLLAQNLNAFTGIFSVTLLQYDLLEIRRAAISKVILDVFLKKLIHCLQEISLNKAKEYELPGINLIHKKKLCVTCRKSIGKQSKSDDAFVELEQIDSDPDFVNDNTDVNSQLENIGISSISNHAKAKSSRISTRKRKLSQINDVFSVSLSKKLKL